MKRDGGGREESKLLGNLVTRRAAPGALVSVATKGVFDLLVSWYSLEIHKTFGAGVLCVLFPGPGPASIEQALSKHFH